MKTYGSHDADEGVSVVCDNYGNVYMGSSFKSGMVMDTFQLNYVGNQDGLISKIDSTGKIYGQKVLAECMMIGQRL